MSNELAYSINRFVQESSISRALLYKLWKEGLGPKRISLGRKVVIPRLDAEAWLAGLQKEDSKLVDAGGK
jgi:predicted DNA-binding transcriptional regulator AlpA